jgi:hypothetical protein
VILCKWIGDGRTEAVQSIRYSDCVGCLSLLCRAILGSFVALISKQAESFSSFCFGRQRDDGGEVLKGKSELTA